MNRALVVLLCVLAAFAVASSSGVGYGLVIDHVPWWGLKYGGHGIGKSIRYDHRFYPYLGIPWIVKSPIVPPLVKPVLPPYGIIKSPVY